ncbi:hypothetical protein K6119_03580 [Paracrocinitomix mangrovi]|uniref:hypothetical protein n=1 Tax=Paracrocinitomix mangrovi TaxID=2862509 RepID=UPI001C8E4D92|nr:hypothetical protein [Paracrocinitomix mangrovi]UKN02592.1 hypothetical protein K6119_03580 [Paracrocinitomix mangrovi]
MKSLTTVLFFISISIIGFSQSKEDLIKSSPKDSVVTYEGEGKLKKGNCLLIKFTGDPVLFFNELIAMHVVKDDQLEMTENSMVIYETSKPFWVYNTYTVYASFSKKDGYSLIEVSFKAYANPYNYQMAQAPKAYQAIIEKLLK